MEKIRLIEHNNKLRSAGNDWRRKSPGIQTPRKRQGKWNQERDKEMERTWAVVSTSIFYFISLYALVSSFFLILYRFNANSSRSWSQGPPRRRKVRDKGN